MKGGEYCCLLVEQIGIRMGSDQVREKIRGGGRFGLELSCKITFVIWVLGLVDHTSFNVSIKITKYDPSGFILPL